MDWFSRPAKRFVGSVHRRTIVVVVLICCASWLTLRATAAATANDPGDSLLRYLQHVIDWYRNVSAFANGSVTPEEVLIQETVQTSSRQALQRSFEAARQEAVLLASAPPPSGTTGPSATQNDRLAQAAAAAVQRVIAVRRKLDQINQQIETSSATSRPALTAQRDKYTAALSLAIARRDVLHTLSLTSGEGNETLSQKIDDLRHLVPDAETADTENPATQPAVTAAAAAATAASATAQAPAQLRSLGLIGLVEEMFTLSRKMNDINDLASRTELLRKSVDELRAPLRSQLMDAIHRGDALTGASETDDPTKLAAQQQELESLTSRFTLLTNASVPLSGAGTALQTTESALHQWHDTVKTRYWNAIRLLVIRLGFMLGAIVLLLLISAIWKRAVFRYVTDVRRRRQFLMVRRLVVGGIILFIVIGGFVTEYGSLATYAGLLTAGIAVALQSVILSGVSHFFFMGRYGVKVGDRVTINGITGDILDIGIFRMYMLELNGQPNNLQPTGRIVVFSNSVLFQPNAFYKQIPGAEYNWHELGLTLSPDSDFHVAEKRLMEAVESVYDEYKGRIESQHDRASETLHVQLAKPQLQGRFRFVDSGLEFVVRYPVEMRRAAEIDDKITRKLIETIDNEPKLKLVATSTPKLQPANGTPQ